MMMPTLVIISALVFTIIELPPGDYFESYMAELSRAGRKRRHPKQIEALRKEYGFDKPPIQRYFEWVAGMLHGDFGYSFEYRLPVIGCRRGPAVAHHLVSFMTIMFTWMIGLPDRHLFGHPSI